MRILWLSNTPLSIIRQKISNSTIQTGGWLDGISNQLLKSDNVDFLTIFPFDRDVSGQDGNIKYQSFSSNEEDKNQIIFFKNVLENFQPDIIHVFGTEFKHSLNMAKACVEKEIIDKLIVNIQGILYLIEKQYYAGLPTRVVNGFTLKELIKRNNIKLQRKNFYKRGLQEIETLKMIRNVSGRTDFDRAAVLQINPNINYHFCNETLRDSFYENEWDIEKCERHSIFVSQSSYPIKGFHKVVEALSIIKNEFPDVRVYVTGIDLFKLSFKEKLKIGSYQKYLLQLIKKYNLTDNIKFLGFLDETKMCERYLKSHCFVSASSIENSPNSLGEAMLLGVPSVSSDVGGVKNMLTHNEDGLIYPFNESNMLAYYVCEIFKNDRQALEFSKNARKHALQTHNKENNFKILINMYKEILGEKNG